MFMSNVTKQTVFKFHHPQKKRVKKSTQRFHPPNDLALSIEKHLESDEVEPLNSTMSTIPSVVHFR